ncbi:di-trans,poly-cis-decaprenylcistransferase [Candidatus Dependentiae bacterium]|nr:di-trans,poly-cis-decaprenylcistransferase [Candidatus Dependentiae bacterium]
MQHLAIIPDGNRRWAKNHKLQSFMGHKKGMEAFDIAIKFCIKNNIKYLSVYTFSLENFKRTEKEKSYLFELLINESKKKLPEFIKNEIRIKFIGNKNFFPKNVTPTINKLENETKTFKKLNLNLLFCYSSKNEIVNATKAISKKVKAGILDPEEINEEKIKSFLWTGNIPDPDLIIRTSSRLRLSNFLLYQSAYSEYMFLDCYWPEITTTNLQECLDKFNQIKRNFGR